MLTLDVKKGIEIYTESRILYNREGYYFLSFVGQEITYEKGFSLIELLVVVLIIGILAAIALPQYTKAVERARLAEGIQVLDNVAKAQSILYMQQGFFAEDIDDLNSSGDITVQDAGDAWEPMMFGIGDLSGSEFITMNLQRSGGMFKDDTLSLSVYPDGRILKACHNFSGKEGFCGMAESAGYVNGSTD